MYEVKRAIILAAGFGKRMQPITLKTPKPLVRVNGIRMIDTVIKGLRDNGINEIYIVVGYLKEKFKNIPDEYSGVNLIENPYFAECNNISSLYVAREHLEDSIILDGDQIIYNSAILNKYFEKSGYNAVWTDEETNEWLLTVKDGSIKGCSRIGGKNGWQLYSISRWNSEDAKRLKRHLEIEFEDNKNTQIYWDDVPLFCHFDEYDLGIKVMKKNDIIEIDNFEELIEIDSSYKI